MNISNIINTILGNLENQSNINKKIEDEINYIKALSANNELKISGIVDVVNKMFFEHNNYMFSNSGVKIVNTPVATYADLSTLDRSSFIDGILYMVYVLADETHGGAKTTYICDKTSSTFFCKNNWLKIM